MAFTKPSREVDRVFLHCSATDKEEHDDVSVMRRWHVEDRGWDDVGYHFFIKKDGTVQPGRDLEKTPAAQRGHNTGTIAICLHGLAVGRFTRDQYRSLIALCQEIDDAFGGMVSFHGHSEVSSKACPVFPYRVVLGLDAHGEMIYAPSETPLQGGDALAEPKPMPEAPLPPRPTLRLMARGVDVELLQVLLIEAGLITDIDGIFGRHTESLVREFQKNYGLVADGIVGPRTWAALEA
jgi:N-acetyl-anhydromuramyl-L-alanine amidase AmpD